MRIDQIQCEVDRILSIAGDDSTVERIFIFGSACDPSRIHEESDLDLCIIQRTTLRFFDRLAGGEMGSNAKSKDLGFLAYPFYGQAIEIPWALWFGPRRRLRIFRDTREKWGQTFKLNADLLL